MPLTPEQHAEALRIAEIYKGGDHDFDYLRQVSRALLATTAKLEEAEAALIHIKNLGNGEHMSVARNLAQAALNPEDVLKP